ncbi:MAG TPA: hypothetical protein VFO82_15250 [Steroidobacteraceae bacterium]|nr:hypothetical protein [Steroidobacteraceae bacterium]
MWLLFELEAIFSVLLAQPVVLGKAPVTLPLLSREDQALNRRISEAARSPAQNVVLVLKGIEAQSRPEVSWEVHVEPAGAIPDAQGPHLVGVFSLFNSGRDPGEFLFVVDNAIAAAGKKDLQVRFVPISGVVVDGKPLPTEVRANVTIGAISLALESAPR